MAKKKKRGRRTGTKRNKAANVNGGILRAVLRENEDCARLFGEAEALAKRIFEADEYVPLSFFTEHGEEHCKAVETFLEQIIWKKGQAELDEEHDFVPTPEEAMYLLSAVWLHDLGMWYGILDNEPPDDLKETRRVLKLRDEHEVRTARYIDDKWKDPDCTWEPDEKDWLSNICVYHRSHRQLSTFEPVKEMGRRVGGRPIRLGVMAALLRLADACHVDKTRAPQRVMGLYISLGMPEEARVHWERADLIKNVGFEHDQRRIELKGHYPRKFDFGLGEFDVQEVGDMICENLRRELKSVQQTLSPFSNTDFREVIHVPRRIQARDYLQKRQCLHLWPYLLSRPFSATEAAAALAQMLLLSTEQAEESNGLGKQWQEVMHKIMNKMKDLRQQDFMIRNLCVEVESRLSGLPEDAKSATELREYLARFTASIKKNCEKMVSYALKEIKPNDVLLLYGHSVNIDQLLRDIDTRHILYVIDCYKPLRGNWVSDENEDIIKSVKDSGFGDKYKFLQLESLSAALGELKRKNMRCKLLLGTHGRLKGGDLLCKVGSCIIAETAKRFGAEVIALCERTKFLSESNRAKDSDIADREQLFSSEDEKKHPQMAGVPYVAPKMDRLPKNLVDMVITEEGIERRWKPKKRVVGRRSPKAKGKKASGAK